MNLAPRFFSCTDGMPCSVEGAFMRRHAGGAGCGACRRGSQSRPRRRGHRPPPMRGPPSVAWTTSDERQRQCCLDNGTSKASGPVKEVTVTVPKIAAVERREGAGALRKGRPGAFRRRCPGSQRRSGAPPPSGEAKETRAKAREKRTERADSPP